MMPPKISRTLKQKTVFSSHLADQLRTSPCEFHCPAGNPVQKITGLVKDGKFEEALEFIRARNPFPGTCGRICQHPCESKCNRGNYDESLSLKALERAAFDYSDSNKVPRLQPLPATGKKVAVIGSGPAGLTGAYFLRLLGHDITLFETLPSLGGLLNHGIPGFRLPAEVVNREIESILSLGIHVKTGTEVGKDISFSEIQKNYNAVLIATGAWKEKKLAVNGGDKAISGLSFLRQVKSGKITSIGRRVAIIGGGGVAFDCAFTAKRLGAAEVHIVCLEPADNMAANAEDIASGKEEGIIVHNSAEIIAVVSSGSTLTGVEFCDVKTFQIDETGRLNIVSNQESQHSLNADTLISAVGQCPDLKYLQADNRFRFSPQGVLEVAPDTRAADIPGIFAAGDAVSGPSCVAESVGSGRLAAVSIHRYLTYDTDNSSLDITLSSDGVITAGKTQKESSFAPSHVVSFDELLHVDYFNKKSRVNLQKSIPVKTGTFAELNQGYSRDQAVEEAGRCFHCGQCFSCGSCVEDCPGYVLSMGERGAEISYPDECWHCGNCRISCPCGAVQYEFPLTMLV